MIPRLSRGLSEPIEYEYDSTDKTGDIFCVRGITGNYQVHIKRETMSTCTCQDFRHRGKLCKHILCILIKHFCLTIEQLRHLDENKYIGINDAPSSTSLSRDTDSCPVCFNCIYDSPSEWTCPQCNYVLHLSCILQWFSALRRQGAPLSCPMCRYETT